MSLIDFYHIHSQVSVDTHHEQYSITFNPQHPIFAAHFPNRPIVPGVCIVEIVRELISKMCHDEYSITEIKNLKFVEIIIPNEQHYLFDIALTPFEDKSYSAKVLVTSDDKSHCYTKISFKTSTNTL